MSRAQLSMSSCACPAANISAHQTQIVTERCTIVLQKQTVNRFELLLLIKPGYVVVPALPSVDVAESFWWSHPRDDEDGFYPCS
jgi:hypothetical protein